MLEIVVAEVLAGGGQLVVLEVGNDLLQLQEELFARQVAVGKDVKGGPLPTSP